MKRLLLATALASVALLAPAPASAATEGCDAPVDVFCNRRPCMPEMPCSIWICYVYVAPHCVA